MAKSKGPRIMITLECTECRQNDSKRSEGVSRYLTSKNRRNTPDKLEILNFKIKIKDNKLIILIYLYSFFYCFC